MEFPDDLKYSKDHEWLRKTESGEAYVGVTDFAQSELGDIVFVELPNIGDSFNQNDVLLWNISEGQLDNLIGGGNLHFWEFETKCFGHFISWVPRSRDNTYKKPPGYTEGFYV